MDKINSQLEGDESTRTFPIKDHREYIYTYTGRQLFFDDPMPAINIRDIAHATSLLCRWTGHTRRFYSIAQHLVLCSKYPTTKGGEPRFALRKLLHDAAEAYVNDLNKPLKNLLYHHDTFHFKGQTLERVKYSLYDQIEGRIERAIYKKYGLSEVMSDEEKKEVKAADLALAMTESRDLLNQISIAHYEGAQPLDYKINPWSAVKAEQKFLNRFLELMQP